MSGLPIWFLAAVLACATSITSMAIVHRYDFSVENTPFGSVKLKPGDIDKTN